MAGLVARLRAKINQVADDLMPTLVTRAIESYLRSMIVAILAEEIPKSERYLQVQEECREQLRRWPALKNDQAMQLEVSRTILKSFQR